MVPRPRPGLLTSLFLAAVAAHPGSARASTFAAQLDTTCHYGYGDTLTVIWKPLTTLPALVRPGDTLTVWANAPPTPTTWSAALQLGGLRYPLTAAGGSFQAGLGWWVLGFTIPSGVPEELYDLVLSSGAAPMDSTRHSVKVLPEFRSDYYFAQISDTHLPEHSFSPSFSTCDTTGMADFDAVIGDLNLIHPEFILHTGDLVNEGELEEFYGDYEMGRALSMVYRLRDPMFLTSGNHDIGGWQPTPPPAGTSRKDWWRYFGWPFLANPPAGAPFHSQDYSFDYDSLHVIGLEAYLNNGSYDNYLPGTYGGGSFTSEQLSWLAQDIAAAGPRHKLVMYHFDFDQGANTGSTSGPWQLNINTLGVDGAIWGHYHSVPENSITPRTAHPFNLGCQSVIDNRAFRIFRVHNGNIAPGPMHHSGTSTDSLSASWSGPNDGTQAHLSVTVNNRFGETWDHARLVFLMADHDSSYVASGGSIAQTIRAGGGVRVYVDGSVPASGGLTVSVSPSAPVAGIALAGGPAGLELAAPSPNPFTAGSGSVTLRYRLPSSGQTRIEVLDVTGSRVALLDHGWESAGEHRLAWDGRTSVGGAAPPGIYQLRLRSASGERSQRLVLMR